MTDRGTLGGERSRADDINDHGEVVGVSTTAAGESHVYLWRKSHITDTGIVSEALWSINGNRELAVTFQNHAVLLKKGQITDLGTLGGSDSAATDINDSKQIVGYS